MPHLGPLYWVVLVSSFWFVFVFSGVVLWWSAKQAYKFY